MELYWRKQAEDPLFGDLLWSQPENRTLAGKLLIIGGNDHAFAAPAQAYQLALEAGVGECRVVMPESVKKLVGGLLPDCEFTPATPSGSFSQKSLDRWLTYAAWSSGILICGDVGRNSETAILLETFLQKTTTPLVITRDAADYFLKQPHSLLNRPDTTVVLSLAELQKIAIQALHPKALTFSIGVPQFVEWLHEFSLKFTCFIVVQHHGLLYCAVQGQVSSTKLNQITETWRLPMATLSSVWWLQNPSRPFEALTTAAYLLARNKTEASAAATASSSD